VSDHTSENNTVNALSAGLMQQTLLLNDTSQEGLMAEQMIVKQLKVVKNQEKLMQQELEVSRSWSC
jgi:hypothetical protein